MFPQSKLDRINELAAIAKKRELTEEERLERAALREEFLDDFRGRFKKQLDDIEIVDAGDPRLGGKKMAKIAVRPKDRN